MQRRNFLKASATLSATVPGLLPSGCRSDDAGQQTVAPVAAGPDAQSSRVIEAHLADLERGLSGISNTDILSRHHGHPALDRGHCQLVQTQATPGQQLAEQSYRSLLLASMYGELSEQDRSHPSVQKRMTEALPEIDSAIYGTLESLESLSSTELQDIHTALNERPESTLELGDIIDHRAQELGLHRAGRQRMRSLVRRMAWRLQHQHPGLLVEEYTSKTRRELARSATDLRVERRLATIFGDAALWAQLSYAGPDAPPVLSEPNPNAGNVDAPAQVLPNTPEFTCTPSQGETPSWLQEQLAEERKAYEAAKQRRMSYFRNLRISGGVLLGVSAAAGASAPFTFGIGGTVGAVLLATGITLLATGVRGRRESV